MQDVSQSANFMFIWTSYRQTMT